MSDKRDFLKAFLRSPGAVGSVVPSSRSLAEQMVRCADIRPGDVIVELDGPEVEVGKERGSHRTRVVVRRSRRN